LSSPPVLLNYNGMKISYNGNSDRLAVASANAVGTEFSDGRLSENMRERVNLDKVTENLIVFVVGQGAFNASAKWDDMPIEYGEPVPALTPVSTPTNILVSAGVSQEINTITMAPTPFGYSIARA
jgi:flagellin